MDDFSTYELCKELKARIENTNGLEFVSDEMLTFIMNEIRAELQQRGNLDAW